MPKGSSPPPKFAKTVSSLALVLIGSSIAFGVVAMLWQRPHGPEQTAGVPPNADAELNEDLAAPTEPAPLQGGVKIKVGFSQKTGDSVVTVPVTRSMPSDYEPIQMEYAIEELLKGPTKAESERGLYSEIPKGTRLLGVKKDKQSGVLVVNLSQQFSTGGGATSLIQRIEEIKQTLRQKAKGQKILLQVDGQPLKILGPEGLEIEQPLDPNAPTQSILEGSGASAPVASASAATAPAAP